MAPRAGFAAASTCRLALATLRRHPIAIALLTIIVFAPLWRSEWHHLRVPPDRGAANALLNFEWAKLAFVWAITMVLAAGIAPLVQATAAGQTLSLRQRLNVIAGALLRAAGPVVLAVAAITIGLVAGVVPGLVLYLILWTIGPTTALRPAPVLAIFRSLGSLTHRRTYGLMVLTFAPLALDIALTAGLHLSLLSNLGTKLNPATADAIYLFTAINIVRTVVWAGFAAVLCAAIGHQLSVVGGVTTPTPTPTSAPPVLPNAGEVP